MTDATTAAPLSNVVIQLYTQAGGFADSTATQADGTYEVGASLPTGTYYARTFNSLGYVNKLYNNTTCAGESSASCTLTSGTAINLAAGSPTTGIDFALAPGGRMSGTVTNSANGQPISGAFVQLYNSAGSYITTAASNGAGVWQIDTGLPAGSYFVRTFNFLGYVNELFDNTSCPGDGYGCPVTSGAPVAVTVGSTTAGINFALDTGGSISGMVVASGTALPLSGIAVQVYNSSGVFMSSSNTNGSGVWSVTTGLPTGTYYAKTSNSAGYVDEAYNDIQCLSCSATSGMPISVTAGSTTNGINFALAVGGQISGLVTDAASGSPLSGIEVDVYTASGAYAGYAFSSSGGTYISGAGLPTGTYYARTSNSAGFINEAYNDVQCLSCSVTSGTPIAVTVGATTSGIDLALTAGGEITGAVTDAGTGAPLSGITVRLMTSSGTNAVSATTDGAGSYHLRGLPTGTYYVGTSNSLGYINEFYDNAPCVATCGSTGGTGIAVTTPGVMTGINFALTVGGRISGTITNATTGLAISGVTVTFYSPSGSSLRSPGNFDVSVSTNALGQYTSGAGLPTGTYYARTSNSAGYIDEAYNDVQCLSCSVTSGTPIAVTVGATTSAIDFALTAGGEIAGTVTDSTTSQPLFGITVRLLPATGGGSLASTTTSSDGTYRLRGLPPGAYKVGTGNSGGYINEIFDNVSCCESSQNPYSAGAGVAVTAGDVTAGIDFALTPGARISGTVTDAVSGLPISGVSVDIFSQSGVTLLAPGNFSTSTTSAANGSYSIPIGLPTGVYYVRTSNSLGYINEAYNDVQCFNCSVTSGTPLAVTAGTTASGINFVLSPGGEIAGTVTNAATTAPISGVTVRLLNAAGSSQLTATTAANGTYRLRGLPPGSYYVGTSNSGGYVNELYNDVQCGICSVDLGAPVAVSAATVTGGVDFALTAGGRISGTVTSASTGLPLSGVSIQLYGAEGKQLLAPGGFSVTVSTNATGVFTTGVGLPTGTYYVATSSSVGYIDEVYNDRVCVSCLPQSGAPVAVVLGATTSGVDFQLSVGGRIAGAVTDTETGLPISGVSVQAFTAGGAFASSGVTDAAGAYTTGSGLPSGEYKVWFVRTGQISAVYNGVSCLTCSIPESGTSVIVTAPATTSGIDAQLAAGGAIGGTVRDVSSGLTLSGASVVFYDSTGRRIAVSTTSSAGTFLRTGLPAGIYYAEALSAGRAPQVFDEVCSNCSPTSGTPIAVVGTATTENTDFSMSVGASPPGVGTVASLLGLGANGVTLRTSIDPNALTTTVSIGYGTTVAYGQASVGVDAGAGDGSVSRDVVLSNLACGTVYHYRIVAANAAGTSYGRDDVFITSACMTSVELSVSDVTATEGDTGSTNVVFTVSLSGSSLSTVTVLATSANNTATAGSDYIATGPTPLTFAPGVTVQTVSVPILGDVLGGEGSETFFVNLSSASGAVITDGQGIGTIVDDDAVGSADANSNAAAARAIAVNSSAQAGLGGPTPMVWYRVALFANRSYQISAWPTADEGATGGVIISMDLFSDAAGTVLVSPGALSTSGALEGSPNDPASDHPRTLIFQPATSGDYRIRLTGAGATREDVNVLLRETTLFSPWFFVVPTSGYESFHTIHNNTADAITVTLRSFDSTGSTVGSAATFSLPGNATVFKTAGGDLATGQAYGGTVLTHSGAFGAVSANTTTLSGVTGLSFDSPFAIRSPSVMGLPIR